MPKVILDWEGGLYLAKLLLVRHGETEWNREGRYQGQSDIQLNATGIRQAERLRDRINGERLDAIYSSDLKRAVTTAGIIASGQGIGTIACSELREIDFGQLEGKNFAQSMLDPIQAKWWNSRDPRISPPGGESINQLSSRVSQFITRVNALSSEKTMLIVAHGGSLRALLCLLLEINPKYWWQMQLDHASLSVVRTSPQGAILSLLNDTSHLAGCENSETSVSH